MSFTVRIPEHNLTFYMRNLKGEVDYIISVPREPQSIDVLKAAVDLLLQQKIVDEARPTGETKEGDP